MIQPHMPRYGDFVTSGWKTRPVMAMSLPMQPASDPAPGHPSVNCNPSVFWTLVVVLIGAPLLGVAPYLAALLTAVVLGYDG